MKSLNLLLFEVRYPDIRYNKNVAQEEIIQLNIWANNNLYS